MENRVFSMMNDIMVAKLKILLLFFSDNVRMYIFM